MSQLAPNAAYLQIEDRLDAIGQKFRAHQIVRGAILFFALASISTVTVALLANLMSGTGKAMLLLPIAWCCLLLVGAFAWIVRPLMIRMESVQVARMLETRLPGLHNGLTNSVLLQKREDLINNPFLDPILTENWNRASNAPLSYAIRLSELRPVALRAGGASAIAILLALVFPASVSHGFSQMLHPSEFVPKTGSAELLEVRPGDVTLVAGQPLEISVEAKADESAEAKLYLEAVDKPAQADPTTSPASMGLEPRILNRETQAGNSKYAYRFDHIDQPMKYRVEVAGTQSRWFNVKIVRQVRLELLTLQINPPAYTKVAPSTINLKAEELEKTPISVPQGSTIDLSATIDVPVNGALLQLGEGQPTTMQASAQGRRFDGKLTVVDDTPVALLLTEGSGQIIARLPESTLMIRCVKDVAPSIEMKWPIQDCNIAPDAELKVSAMLKDDFGLTGARVLMSSSADQPLVPVTTKNFADGTASTEFGFVLTPPAEVRKHGNSIRVQLEATDNRSLASVLKDGGPQTVTSSIIEIRFRDPKQLAGEQKQQSDKLRLRLQQLLKMQQDILSRTVGWKPADAGRMAQVNTGQIELRDLMQNTADTFDFSQDDKVVQKTLLVLTKNAAREAIDLSGTLQTEKDSKLQKSHHSDLQSRQRRMISTLESLLALLSATPEPTTQPTTRPGGDLLNKAEQYKQLQEAMQKFIKEEQRILDQTANLAKKPVDNFDDKDKKLLEELAIAQEKLDAFMQTKVNDLSKLAEQDMSNASLLKELLEVYSEVTMAKDALKQKAVEIAVPLEEAGLELAKEISSNLEKWLMDSPDRQKWTQEEFTGKQDVPMAELPKELEDMVGELMEQQEDLFDEMEDMDANMTDSLDKGAGWDAADGPIANMSAKGVTGNQLPNNNNMGGRSGEGRSGKSQGEFVEETASGKGGRNTPTRLDPTPFQQGQIKDESKDPVGGATGGGKVSGQGGQGLEGPVPPKMAEEMKRLAQKQAQLRNNAERLNLKYQLGRYDNFKLLESIAMMRRVESDLGANHYQVSLRRRDILLDSMDTSRALIGGTIHVQQDTTPGTSAKLEQDLHDAMKGDLPAAWSDALKEYYKKLASE